MCFTFIVRDIYYYQFINYQVIINYHRSSHNVSDSYLAHSRRYILVAESSCSNRDVCINKIQCLRADIQFCDIVCLLPSDYYLRSYLKDELKNLSSDEKLT